MLQFLQTGDVNDDHETLDQALRLLTYTWINVSLDWKTKLLPMAQSLVGDQRMDVDQSAHSGATYLSFHYCPEVFLPIINPALTRPIETLNMHEKLDFLAKHTRASALTPGLFTSLIPTAHISAFKAQAQSGKNIIHIIAECMGCQIWNSVCFSTSVDAKSFWDLVSMNPILREWEQLLKEWLRIGCDLFGRTVQGYTPLRSFFDRAGVVSRSTQNGLALPIQYWVKCIVNANIDLMEYGARELRSWKSPFQIDMYRRDAVWSPQVEFLATGFRYGPSVADWALIVEGKGHIPLYRLHFPPGSWPEASFLPRRICWQPSVADQADGASWTLERTVDIEVMPVPTKIDVFPEYVDLFSGIQDDSLAAARLFAADDHESVVKRPRRGSEPPPSRLWQEKRWFSGPEVSTLTGYLYYCPFCCRRIVTPSVPSHRRHHICPTYGETRVWETERIRERVLQWKKFCRDWGSEPTICTLWITGNLFSPILSRITDAEDLFTAYHRFCDGFPHCQHQRSYLDVLDGGSAMM